VLDKRACYNHATCMWSEVQETLCRIAFWQPGGNLDTGRELSFNQAYKGMRVLHE
jgi:hypothetical protein